MRRVERYSLRLYWRYARRNSARAKFFALHRAIPSLLIALLQFIWIRRDRPVRELLLVLATICAVYLGLFALENLWNLVAVTPSRIYAEQVRIIGELSAKNSFLEEQLREPRVSPREQRRRELVSENLKKLGRIGRKILRCVADHGELRAMALVAEYQFTEAALNAFYERAIPAALILYENHKITLNPELGSAIEFVLDSEYRLEAGAAS